jgi:anthranilate/para-aminobenzoate synthase component II
MVIYIITNYDLFNHLITSSLRDLDIEVPFIRNAIKASEVQSGCDAIILGEGHDSARAGKCAEYFNFEHLEINCTKHRLCFWKSLQSHT